MSASSVMNELGTLSETLSTTEDRIAELREQIAAFQGVDNGVAPVVLPADWDFTKTTNELNSLLQTRHTANVKFRQLSEKHEAARSAERKRKLDALRTKYKESVVRLLQGAVTLSLAAKEGQLILDEAMAVAGHGGSIPHCGPNLGGWNPDDMSSFVAHWLTEGVRLGYISGNESWLRGMSFSKV